MGRANHRVDPATNVELADHLHAYRVQYRDEIVEDEIDQAILAS